MTIPTISTLPTAPARTDAPATFISRADAFLAALVTMQGELNTSIGAMNTDIAQANTDAAAAAASATAAANASNADVWVSGTTYALGDVVYSPTDYQSYRRIVAGAGTTDPSSDAVNWTKISAEPLPSQSGNSGKYLTTNGTNPSWVALSTDPTLATQTKTYISGEISTLTLSSAVTAGVPVVSVTKEVPQTGVTNNQWDVNSTAENYTRVDSAYATTLTPSATGDGTFTLGTGSFAAGDVGKTIIGNGGVAILTATDGSYVTTTDFTDTSAIASGNWEMYAVVYNTTDGDLELSGKEGFDISTASFVDSFSVSAQDTSPVGIAFNTDGTKMFIVGTDGDDVNEYTLGTGFDVSTATYSQNFSVASQDTSPWGIAFNTDGTKMFIVGNAGDDVNEYTLGTGFDVSTASFVDAFSVSAQETDPKGIAFNTDGTKMFIVGLIGDDVNEYTLSAASIPSGYHAAHTTISTDSTYWTDINSMTADESAASGNVYYAVSTDDRATWKIAHNTDGIRSIVRNNAGTWEYNSNSTYGSETWTAASTNTELSALQESMAEAKNQMDKTQLEAVTDANHFTLGNDLDLAIIFNLSSGSTLPSSDGVSINYDANTLNEGAIIGTDYDFDFPATDKVRITALADNNLKVRVV